MFILSEHRSRDRTAILARLNPLEADARGSFQIKVIDYHRFRNLDDAQRYARQNGLYFDMDAKRST